MRRINTRNYYYWTAFIKRVSNAHEELCSCVGKFKIHFQFHKRHRKRKEKKILKKKKNWKYQENAHLHLHLLFCYSDLLRTKWNILKHLSCFLLPYGRELAFYLIFIYLLPILNIRMMVIKTVAVSETTYKMHILYRVCLQVVKGRC